MWKEPVDRPRSRGPCSSRTGDACAVSSKTSATHFSWICEPGCSFTTYKSCYFLYGFGRGDLPAEPHQRIRHTVPHRDVHLRCLMGSVRHGRWRRHRHSGRGCKVDGARQLWGPGIIPSWAVTGRLRWQSPVALHGGIGAVLAAIELRRSGSSWGPVLLLVASSLSSAVFRTRARPGGPITFELFFRSHLKRSSHARHSVERGGDGESRRVIQEARGRILREPVPAMCEVEGVWPDALWICWNRGYSSANSGGDGQAANCVGFSHLIFSVAIGQWGPDASCSTTAQA